MAPVDEQWQPPPDVVVYVVQLGSWQHKHVCVLFIDCIVLVGVVVVPGVAALPVAQKVNQFVFQSVGAAILCNLQSKSAETSGCLCLSNMKGSRLDPLERIYLANGPTIEAHSSSRPGGARGGAGRFVKSDAQINEQLGAAAGGGGGCRLGHPTSLSSPSGLLIMSDRSLKWPRAQT